MIVAVADKNRLNRGGSHHLHSSFKGGSSSGNLYSRESRRSLRNVRVRSSECCPHRSLSADYEFALPADDKNSSSGDVTLELKENAPDDGVELEVCTPRRSLSRKSSSRSKMTLDELLQSHHSSRRGGRRRQRLMANNGLELRKSLSYGQIQDMTRNFSRSNILGLNESLHDIQRKRQPEILGAKLANMFEAAVQDSNPRDVRLIPTVRKLILGLSVETMVEIVQHLDKCQIEKAPIQWDFLQSKIDPTKIVEWDHDMMRHLKKTSSVASGMVSRSEYGDSNYEEVSYESLSYYEEELLSEGSSQSSYIHTDDGQNYKPIDFNDEDSDITGLSLEAYTECCDSSITIDELESLCDPEESFALASSHHVVVVDMPHDFDASVYSDVMDAEEEAMIAEMEVDDAEELIEEEIEEEEFEEEELVEDTSEHDKGLLDDPESSEVTHDKISMYICSGREQERAEDTVTATDESTVGPEEVKVTLEATVPVSSQLIPNQYDKDKEGTPQADQSMASSSGQLVSTVSNAGKLADRKAGFLRSNPSNPPTSPKIRNPMESRSFKALQQSQKVSSLVAQFEMRCKPSVQ